MKSLAEQVSDKQKKSAVVALKSGDSVRVHQKVIEGGKERVQIFEGTVMRVSRSNSLTASFAVRRISSGVGVEKSFFIHSPNILKVEVTKRSRVRRNRLNYMRSLRGKSSRLSTIEFDKESVNAIHDEQAEAEEAKMHKLAEVQHEADAEAKAAAEATQNAKVEEALAARDSGKSKSQFTESAAAPLAGDKPVKTSS